MAVLLSKHCHVNGTPWTTCACVRQLSLIRFQLEQAAKGIAPAVIDLVRNLKSHENENDTTTTVET